MNCVECSDNRYVHVQCTILLELQSLWRVAVLGDVSQAVVVHGDPFKCRGVLTGLICGGKRTSLRLLFMGILSNVTLSKGHGLKHLPTPYRDLFQ